MGKGRAIESELQLPASVSADSYRRVMRRWPSGVTVVTTRTDDGPHGMTASAFTSVSIDPPMVLVVADKRGHTGRLIQRSGCFCANILGSDQVEISERFSGRLGDPTERFAGLSTTVAQTGAPVLSTAIGFVDCVLDAAHDAGDHTILVGRVVGCDVQRTFDPLAYYDTRYARVSHLGEG